MANWEGVSEFVAVAQHKSFTQAARELTTSVAQVSRKVAAIEKRLSIKLLNRTTRKITLTEAGHVYFEECRMLVEGLANAEVAVTQMQSTPSGLIKITAPTTYGEQRIAPLVNQFLLLYPEVQVDLVLTNQKLDIIGSGVDVAIRLGMLEDSSLMAKRLATRQLYVCASPAYIERHGAPHSLSELKQHHCLLGSVDYWRFCVNAEDRTIKTTGRLKCNNGPALLDAAIKGLGIVQLPDFYVKNALKQGDLVELLPAYRVGEEGIWALFPENRNLSKKVRLFIDFLAQHLA